MFRNGHENGTITPVLAREITGNIIAATVAHLEIKQHDSGLELTHRRCYLETAFAQIDFMPLASQKDPERHYGVAFTVCNEHPHDGVRLNQLAAGRGTCEGVLRADGAARRTVD